MSETFRCDDKEMLVAYLYGEIDPVGRREVDRHLRTCAACTQELDGLQAVRRDLESWQPPDAELGFAVVQRDAAILRPSRWLRGSVPAWAQAAAAILVLAAGAAIANVQVKYDAAGLTMSTGWMTPAPTPLIATAPGAQEAAAQSAVADRAPATPAAAAAEPRRDEWRPALIALEQELRGELAQIRRTSTPVDGRTADASTTDAAVIRRVESLIAESETRQRQELALRMTQLTRDFNVRRSADMRRVNEDLGRLQGQTIAGFNMLRRVSTQPNP